MSFASRPLACLVLCSGLSLAQTDYSLPANTGAIDVTTLGARGNDSLDDEKIIEKAIRDYQDAWRTIYLPAGTYYVSGTIGDMDSLGNLTTYDRFYTLRGAGPGRTVIRLRDGSPGFQDPAIPRPVVLCWNRRVVLSQPIVPDGTVDNTSSNDCHSIQVLNLTIDVGDNNPGAVGLDFTAHNGGGVENVEIRAGATSGKIGLAMNRMWPGPALINNVTITGFGCGIHLRYQNYNMVLENITLQSQRTVGLQHDDHVTSIRRLVSHNSVPAVRNTGTQGILVLIDCLFDGGSPGVCAIENSHALFARNVVTAGYQSALKNGDSVVSGDTIRELITEPWQCVIPRSPRRSLGLSIKETPAPTLDNPSTWRSIESHQAAATGGKWALAIAAAIQTGATTLYLPNRVRYQTYGLGQTVQINGSLRRIVGLGSSLSGGRIVFDNADPSATLVLDQVRFDTLEHRSPGTLVVRRCLGSNISTFPGSGDLFIDDICGSNMVFQGSNVWARQLNNESNGLKIHNKGGRLWMLGYKTENPTTVLTNTDGAQTEILGGENYPVFAVADTVPMYINIESALSVIQTYNFYYIPDAPKYPYYVKEVQDGAETRVDSTLVTFTRSQKLARVLYVANPDSVGAGGDSDVGQLSVRGPARHAIERPVRITARDGLVRIEAGAAFTGRIIAVNGRILQTLRGTGARASSALPRGIYCVEVRTGGIRCVQRVNLVR